MSVADVAVAPWTERRVLDLLHARYGRFHGNGPRYVCAEHVRNGASFYADRTLDMIAIDLWTSGGLATHGHEVKVSRSDWLVERRVPEKAESFAQFLDYFWVVAPAGVVQRAELPTGYGLIQPTPDGLALRVLVRAKRRTGHEPMGWPMITALIRAAAKTAARYATRSTEHAAVSA